MSVGSLLLGATLVVLVALFLARPLLLSNARFGRHKSLRQDLQAQKEAILAQIEVLEFDFETGTIPEEDYRQQRQQMVAEAAEILKNLDDLSAKNELYTPDKTDSEIEATIARLRQRQSPPRPVAAPYPVNAAPKPKTQTPVPAVVEASDPANGRVKFCSRCGQGVEEGDNFCAFCGHQILQPQTT